MIFEMPILRSSGNADALNLLGLLHSQTGHLKAALRHFAEAVRQAPRQAGFVNNLGNVYKGLGRLGKAIESYRWAVALDADLDPEASTRRAYRRGFQGVGQAPPGQAKLASRLSVAP